MRAPPSLTTPTLPRYAHIVAATELAREYERMEAASYRELFGDDILEFLGEEPDQAS